MFMLPASRELATAIWFSAIKIGAHVYVHLCRLVRDHFFEGRMQHWRGSLFLAFQRTVLLAATRRANQETMPWLPAELWILILEFLPLSTMMEL